MRFEINSLSKQNSVKYLNEMDIVDITKEEMTSGMEASSSQLVSPINMRKDASHLNNQPYLVNSNTKIVPKRSKLSLLGINRKKYNFVNTISSKVVPIDCLDSQALNFVKDPIKLKECSKSSFNETGNIDRLSMNNYDMLPTIRILKDKGKNHSNSSVDKSDDMVTNESTNIMLVETQENLSENGYLDERKIQCK